MCWVEWLNENAGAITGAATAVIALFAIVTAFLTKTLADENRLLRKAETEPEVVVYLAPHPTIPHAIHFVLANIGRGPAKKVVFNVTAEVADLVAHDVSATFTTNVGGKGTNVLPQGERIETLFGMGPTLLNPLPLRPFNVTLTYENLSAKTYTSSQQVDVRDLGWISWLGNARGR